MLPLNPMNKDNVILITGGAGYIGTHTVVELVKAGFTPVIIDDFRNANRIALEGLTKILQFEPTIFEIDVCDTDSLEKIFQHYSIKGIIHFAAFKAVGDSVLNPLSYYHNNLESLVNMLKICKLKNIQNFIF